jgi:hypothetical protein
MSPRDVSAWSALWMGPATVSVATSQKLQVHPGVVRIPALALVRM